MAELLVDFQTALESCLHEIGQGESLEGCLARYPHFADQLKPYLETVLHMRQLSALERQIFADAPVGVPFNVALNHSIQMLMLGKSAEQCYQQYPEYAVELKPWLEAVLDLRENGAVGTVKSIGYPEAPLGAPKTSFEAALEDCLAAIANGTPPEVALARQPYYAEQLRRWVYYIATLRSRVDLPSPQNTPEIPARPPALRKNARWQANYSLSSVIASVVLMLVFLFGGQGLILASTESLPGDSLYPIKRAVEQVQLEIAPGSEAVREFIAAERRREARVLLNIQREARVDFEGEILFVNPNLAIISNVGFIFSQPGIDFSRFKSGNVVYVEGYTDLDRKGIVADSVILQPPTLVVFPAVTATPVNTALPTPVFVTPAATPTAFIPPTSPTDPPVETASPTNLPLTLPSLVPTETERPPLPPDTPVPPSETALPTLTPVESLPTATESLPTATEIPETATLVPPATDTPAASDTPSVTETPPAPTVTPDSEMGSPLFVTEGPPSSTGP